MVSEIVEGFWHDDDGFLHAKVARGYKVLGDYLVTDVGAVGGTRWLRAVEAAQRGLAGQDADDLVNDGYSVEVDGVMTTIEALHDEETRLVITTAEYKAALDAYRAFRDSSSQ